MAQLSEESKQKLIGLKDFLEKAEIHELLPFHDAILSIDQSLKALVQKEVPQNEVEFPEVQKIEIPGVSIITLKGDPLRYEDLTDEQKAELKGEPGTDYILTAEDKKTIAKSITVPVVEKIIEKTEIVYEQPIVTNEIKEVAVAETAEQIRDKIGSLEDDDRLSINELKDVDELEKRIVAAVPRGGGGVSAMGVRQAFKYIFHGEQPVGAIDGVNTTYTVQNTIFGIMSFALNGEVVAQLPNYTISGRTITFSTPLPAVYSGTDFEVKYIG